MTTLNNFIALTLPLTGILVGMCGAVLALVGLVMSKRWSLQKKPSCWEEARDDYEKLLNDIEQIKSQLMVAQQLAGSDDKKESDRALADQMHRLKQSIENIIEARSLLF